MKYLPYKDARKIVRRQKLKSKRKYHDWIKENCIKNIPLNPYITYKNCGWKDWFDWLDKPRKWLDFKEAREIIRSSGLKSQEEYQSWIRDNDIINIPKAPQRVYKKSGWKGWTDWLDNSLLPFEVAREIIRKSELNAKGEYVIWAKSDKRPYNIPSNPASTYKNNGWISWPDWFGKPVKNYLPFEKARQIVRSKGFSKAIEYKQWVVSSGTNRFPTSPSSFYKNKGWEGWYDWLGKEKKEYLSFHDARRISRSLNLLKSEDWTEFMSSKNKLKNMPANPSSYYKNDGWIDWADWLGTEWWTFEKAREFVRDLGLKSYKEWRDWADSEKRPPNISPYPENLGIYKDSWLGLPDWVGIEYELPQFYNKVVKYDPIAGEKIRATTSVLRRNKNCILNVDRLAEIDDIYRHVKSLNKNAKDLWHVDHVVPINNGLVCGLHTPENLQIIDSKLNNSKSNKFVPYSICFVTGKVSFHYDIIGSSKKNPYIEEYLIKILTPAPEELATIANDD